MEAPHYWANKVLADGVTAADLTVSEPALIGWLHTLEAISQLCMASARYRAAANYARRVLKAEGYPPEPQAPCCSPSLVWKTRTAFALAHQLEEEIGADALENSLVSARPHDPAVQNKQDAPGDTRCVSLPTVARAVRSSY